MKKSALEEERNIKQDKTENNTNKNKPLFTKLNQCVKMMSKSMGTTGIGGILGKTVAKCPLFGTARNAETNVVAEYE